MLIKESRQKLRSGPSAQVALVSKADWRSVWTAASSDCHLCTPTLYPIQEHIICSSRHAATQLGIKGSFRGSFTGSEASETGLRSCPSIPAQTEDFSVRWTLLYLF